jgi:hypothetical protein
MGNPLEVLEGFDAGRTLALINRLGGREAALDIAAGRRSVTVEQIVLPHSPFVRPWSAGW